MLWSRITFGTLPPDLMLLIEDIKILPAKLHVELSPACIGLPPLRSRGTDVLVLADHFRKQARGIGHLASDFAPDAIALLKAYEWPGNVVELAHCISHAVALCAGAAVGTEALGLGPQPTVLSMRAAQQPFNQQYVSDVLERVDGRRQEAARLLSIAPLRELRLAQSSLRLVTTSSLERHDLREQPTRESLDQNGIGLIVVTRC